MHDQHLLLVLALASLVFGYRATADDRRDRFETRVFTNQDGGQLPYRLLKPRTAQADQKYPLVLFLHGAGERGNDNRKQLVHGMKEFASDAIMDKYPAFVVAPQCPQGSQWVNAPWSAPAHTMPEQPSDSMQLVFQLLAALEDEFPIDSHRIYITGLSMGGFGTWDAIQRQPNRFAAAIPICGGGDTDAVKRIAHLPIWVFHGDKDTAVNTNRSRDMVAALKQAGGKPKYTEYPNTGHDSWTATYNNTEVYRWLFAQRKPD